MRRLFILPIRFYQLFISPMLGSRCRFQPTCSHYMVDAINEWGVFKGIWLGLKRIGRCHPWGPAWSYDPVPPNPRKKTAKYVKKDTTHTDKSMTKR
ncbi:MAG: membrane protein insertion efficiency factor YidD [Saprospiraceae bacterium]